MASQRSGAEDGQRSLGLALLAVAWFVVPAFLVVQAVMSRLTFFGASLSAESAEQANRWEWWAIVTGVGIPMVGVVLSGLRRGRWLTFFVVAALIYCGWTWVFDIAGVRSLPAPQPAVTSDGPRIVSPNCQSMGVPNDPDCPGG
ncbi:hypothetical protein [Kineococcus radiotolerans]|uniref:Uncharacterized protein n=1 Tax=Kineococcus radiotolerans (strain ATCC BAA-149 / DSM 14245 / SRS30216) TaxID=266940 RepID=A6WGX3_KINRD|nr:hypothetical protein [Kineococcus radiotolerans]ABS06062.1 hypothetical protein Krad_4603 [Kineococcus radiotolerans SRS30216 = ATCC BAA-149]